MTSPEFIRQAVAESTARANALPPGPWIVSGRYIFSKHDCQIERIAEVPGRSSDFIAHSRTDIPARDAALLVAVDALEFALIEFTIQGNFSAAMKADAACNRMAEILKGDR